MYRQNGEINNEALDAEAKNVADFGQPLMDAVKLDERQLEAANAFLQEDLPYYQEKIARLMNRPEAADFFKWMQDEAAKDDGVLFKVLLAQSGRDS